MDNDNKLRVSDDDVNEGADPVVLGEADIEEDDISEDLLDVEDEEEEEEKDAGFGSDDEKADGKVSLETLRERELE
jgi:hypothetical protein